MALTASDCTFTSPANSVLMSSVLPSDLTIVPVSRSPFLSRYLVSHHAPREETLHPCNPYVSVHNSSPLFKFYLRYRTGPSRERGRIAFSC